MEMEGWLPASCSGGTEVLIPLGQYLISSVDLAKSTGGVGTSAQERYDPAVLKVMKPPRAGGCPMLLVCSVFASFLGCIKSARQVYRTSSGHALTMYISYISFRNCRFI